MLLDLTLPHMSGRDVCRHVKQSSPKAPVIVLSSMADVVDQVLLLELGRMITYQALQPAGVAGARASGDSAAEAESSLRTKVHL